MPLRFKVHDPLYPHFITSTVLHWIPVFCRDDYFAVLVNSLAHCVENRGLVIHGFVLMPNHFHMLCSQSKSDLVGVIRDMKRYTSHQITQMLERDGRNVWLHAMQRAANNEAQAKLWDTSFHPEQVYTEEFCQQKMDYMHNNPVRAGYVEQPQDWKYSSAGFYYEDKESIIPIDPLA